MPPPQRTAPVPTDGKGEHHGLRQNAFQGWDLGDDGHHGEFNEKRGKFAGNGEKKKWRREERGSKRVRLLHVSRPLVGGLIGVPESAGELDTTTVEKYAAVFKSYQGTRFQAVHDGVVFFFSCLVSALLLKLALGWNKRRRLGKRET